MPPTQHQSMDFVLAAIRQTTADATSGMRPGQTPEANIVGESRLFATRAAKTAVGIWLSASSTRGGRLLP